MDSGYVYAADIVLAAEGTRFVTAFAAIGLSGDGGGTWHLPRLIGPARAARAYLENRPITAEQALDWGMISEIVPAGGTSRTAPQPWPTRWPMAPPAPSAGCGHCCATPGTTICPSSCSAETEGIKATGDTVDATNAIASFAAKQHPQFEGR